MANSGDVERLKNVSYLQTLVANLKWLINRLSASDAERCSLSCYELGHTWTPYCRQAFIDILRDALKYSFKVYSTLYLLTALVKRKKLEFYTQLVWKDILRSTVFLTSNGALFVALFCLWSELQGGFSRTNPYFPALIASALAITIEKESRRSLLALYMANLGLETLFRMLVDRKLVYSLPYGEIVLFSVGLAGLLHYDSKGKVDSFSHKVLSLIFGSDDNNEGNISNSNFEASIYTRIHEVLPQKLKAVLNKCVNMLKGKHSEKSHMEDMTICLLQKFLSRFVIGYCLHSLIKLPGSIAPILSGKKSVLSWLFAGDNLRVGAFLGSMSSIYQAVGRLLLLIKGKTTPQTDKIVAGLVTGLSMLWYRSPAISLYIFIRLADIICKQLVESGRLPNIKHSYALLYSISTALLFHAAVWEPHNIRPAYWKFMMGLTGGKFALMNRRLLDKVFGVTASRLFPTFWPNYDSRFTTLSESFLKSSATDL